MKRELALSAVVVVVAGVFASAASAVKPTRKPLPIK
jgi:hypothetical protein